MLQRIPVLTVLLELEKQSSVGEVGGETKTADEENTNETSVSDNSASAAKAKDITLYEWISSSDDRSTLDQVYDHCQRGLEQVK